VQIAVEVGDRKAAAALLPECRRAGTYDLVAAAESRVTGNAARSETTGDMASRMGVEHLVLMAQSIELYNSGDVAGAIAALDSVLESRPDQVDARVLRGRYRHTAGDKAGAIADLDQALKGSSWVEAHRSGALSGILRASDQDLLERMQSEGAELLVVLLIEKGDLSGAQTRLQTAREALGAEAALSAAQVRLHMAQGNLSGAWATADSGLKVWSRHETLLNAAGELALQDPSHLSPAVRQALTDSPRWSDRYNLALAAHKAGDISVCAQAATLAQVGAGSGRPEVARLAWTCAVEAGDLARADQALGSVADPPHSTAYNHALLRYNAGRKSEAWALLQPLLARPSGKASTDAALAALGLRCLADTHRYDEAVQLSTRKDISPADLVWLGGLLASQHRDPEALALLQRGCSALQAPDRRCTELLPELAQP
jgi:tetratricopeptide (TPR) repeat protein